MSDIKTQFESYLKVKLTENSYNAYIYAINRLLDDYKVDIYKLDINYLNHLQQALNGHQVSFNFAEQKLAEAYQNGELEIFNRKVSHGAPSAVIGNLIKFKG